MHAHRPLCCFHSGQAREHASTNTQVQSLERRAEFTRTFAHAKHTQTATVVVVTISEMEQRTRTRTSDTTNKPHERNEPRAHRTTDTRCRSHPNIKCELLAFAFAFASKHTYTHVRMQSPVTHATHSLVSFAHTRSSVCTVPECMLNLGNGFLRSTGMNSIRVFHDTTNYTQIIDHACSAMESKTHRKCAPYSTDKCSNIFSGISHTS